MMPLKVITTRTRTPPSRQGWKIITRIKIRRPAPSLYQTDQTLIWFSTSTWTICLRPSIAEMATWIPFRRLQIPIRLRRRRRESRQCTNRSWMRESILRFMIREEATWSSLSKAQPERAWRYQRALSCILKNGTKWHSIRPLTPRKWATHIYRIGEVGAWSERFHKHLILHREKFRNRWWKETPLGLRIQPTITRQPLIRVPAHL